MGYRDFGVQGETPPHFSLAVTCRNCSYPQMPRYPESACTVTTEETLDEATIAITSFLHFHPDTPIYVACPDAIAYRVASIAPSVKCVPMDLTIPSTVMIHNDFHRPDAILMKMHAMDAALKDHEDCFFFDADLIFFSAVTPQKGDHELLLSLNLSETPDMGVTAQRYGVFNAGFIWTRNKSFPGWWRDAYLNPKQADAFYEQTCLSLAPVKFRTDYFPISHNYGFWRGDGDRRPIASAHCHMTEALTMSSWMRERVLPLRRVIWERMPPELLKPVRNALGHPSKVFFVHYGKAGGVYSNICLKKAFRGYRIMDSWASGLDRDWSSDELLEHLTTAGEHSYLHQHHYNTSAAHIEAAVLNGWTTVMFYRDPLETICSLYSWGNDQAIETGYSPSLDEKQAGPISFDQFFDRITEGKFQSKWAIPAYAGMIDHLSMFSPQNLDRLLVSLTGTVHKPHSDRNASRNPGVAALFKPNHIHRLEALPAYHRSLSWINRLQSSGSTASPEPENPLPLQSLLSISGVL